jgi:hypothetical protein
VNAEAISNLSTKEYRPVGIWRLIPLYTVALGLILSIVILIPLFTAPQIDTATRIVLIVGAFILLLIGVLVGLAFRGTRLVTSTGGVTYHGVGFRVYTPWDNIQGMGEGTYKGNHAYGTRFYQPDRQVKGLLLRNPAVVGYKIQDGIRQHIPVIEVTFPLLAMLNMNRFAGVIPTSTFFDNSTYQDFLVDAKRYAPKAFDTK